MFKKKPQNSQVAAIVATPLTVPTRVGELQVCESTQLNLLSTHEVL